MIVRTKERQTHFCTLPYSAFKYQKQQTCVPLERRCVWVPSSHSQVSSCWWDNNVRGRCSCPYPIEKLNVQGLCRCSEVKIKHEKSKIYQNREAKQNHNPKVCTRQKISRKVKHAWISLSKVSIKVFSSSSTYIDMCGSKQDEIVPRKLNAIAACNRDD